MLTLENEGFAFISNSYTITNLKLSEIFLYTS